MLLGWLGKRLHDQVDELRKSTVTREELQAVVSDIRDERVDMHRENRETLKEHRETLNRIHERVDDLWALRN